MNQHLGLKQPGLAARRAAVGVNNKYLKPDEFAVRPVAHQS